LQVSPSPQPNLTWQDRPYHNAYLPTRNKGLGVYVIWSANSCRLVLPIIYVGQGDDFSLGVNGRLRNHQNHLDPNEHALCRELQSRRKKGHGLHFSVANASADHLDGIERYLVDTLLPIIPRRLLEAAPRQVNLPFFDASLATL